MTNNKTTIFGEESFIIPNLAREFYDEMIEYRNDKFVGKIACDFLLDKDKVKRQLELCARLENIEKTDLIDMATKKKFADKDYEIKVLHKVIADLQSQLAITEKALELACETLQDINFKLFNTEMNFVDYFKQEAKGNKNENIMC